MADIAHMNISALGLLTKTGRSKYALVALVAAALLAGCGGGSNASPASSATTALSTVVTGLTAPLDLQQPNDDSGRLFIVQQGSAHEEWRPAL